MKGRQRRLKNFGQRATALLRDAKLGRGVVKSAMDFRPIFRGIGQNKRLILKRQPWHVEYLEKKQLPYILNEMASRVPKKFALETLAHSPDFKVQEYRDRPSVFALGVFFRTRFLKKPDFHNGMRLEKSEALKCKKLLGQFKGITPDLLQDAFEELEGYFPSQSNNVLVLGLKKDGRIRLALCDV